ncbi:hypothetical protein AYR62_13095 [Secundilactobacillus paracollinoides]|uniref:TetR/AcrR family transcriptional regulator n=1 Tax=Secundilactobacillus paracollinoides TaxID=240427 RepID=UPI0006D03FE3|nr:TetR/AcrR family transcriptional regulator [Secundilactobacillus paracollinoides]ANZ64916.1 hypothetical protein AYR62_13095 [Secundilactobacillus paracollinoides]KRL80993.1 hypothetical protein FC17_GL002808 [Secundilactobacillus paracollinoides DSM 15502 = JCM 11969]
MNDNDLRVRKTKQQLQRVLIQLLQTTTFSKITVKQICDTTLINRTTFYQHYHDKSDLLYDMFEGLTIDNHNLALHRLMNEPFTMFVEIVKAPLPDIISKQNSDPEFHWTYRQYFLNYYMEALNRANWSSTIPKELVAYTLVNNAFSFLEWQADLNVTISERELNALFRRMIKLPDV